VDKKDGDIYHDIRIVSAVCISEMITERIIKKPVVDVAQSWVNHVNYCVFLSFYVIEHECFLYA
jgi:hypothetical protein